MPGTKTVDPTAAATAGNGNATAATEVLVIPSIGSGLVAKGGGDRDPDSAGTTDLQTERPGEVSGVNTAIDADAVRPLVGAISTGAVSGGHQAPRWHYRLQWNTVRSLAI